MNTTHLTTKGKVELKSIALIKAFPFATTSTVTFDEGFDAGGEYQQTFPARYYLGAVFVNLANSIAEVASLSYNCQVAKVSPKV